MAVRNHTVVACDGEWDISRADEFERLGAEALTDCPGVLFLDFRPAAFAEATTVGAICALAPSLRARMARCRCFGNRPARDHRTTWTRRPRNPSPPPTRPASALPSPMAANPHIAPETGSRACAIPGKA